MNTAIFCHENTELYYNILILSYYWYYNTTVSNWVERSGLAHMTKEGFWIISMNCSKDTFFHLLTNITKTDKKTLDNETAINTSKQSSNCTLFKCKINHYMHSFQLFCTTLLVYFQVDIFWPEQLLGHCFEPLTATVGTAAVEGRGTYWLMDHST